MLARNKVETIIGKGFADKLDEAIFQSGNMIYTRREMVEELGCANFIAAAKLAKVLRRLKIYTVSQLHRMDPFSLARTRGIGESCLFVAMCILDAHGQNVLKWWGWHGNTNKFSSFKSNTIRHAYKHKQEVA